RLGTHRSARCLRSGRRVQGRRGRSGLAGRMRPESRVSPGGGQLMSAPKSAYPVPVEELLPKARELARRLGEVPSRNRLMSEFRIGARKAKELLKHLNTTGIGSDEPGESGPARRLHLVSDTDSTDIADAVTQP